MTLYDLLNQISNIVTPETGAFYEYAIYTSDDNGGFLRTRYCWWPDKPVSDFELGNDFSKVMVTAKAKITEKDLLDKTATNVKMQVTYSEDNANVEGAEWDIELGYCYIYIFDLKQGIYSMTYLENTYT